MSMKLNAEIRDSKNPREMRRAGQIPAVVYGKDYHQQVALPEKDLLKLLKKVTRSSRIDVDIDGESHATYIKDIQYHPLSDKVLHVDLFKPADGQIVKMQVPVRFNGEAIGRKTGGVVNRVRDFINVRGPADLIPEIIDWDITDVDVGDAVRAGDFELPEGIELTTLPEVLLIRCMIPRRAKADVEAELGEGEEGAAVPAGEAGDAGAPAADEGTEEG